MESEAEEYIAFHIKDDEIFGLFEERQPDIVNKISEHFYENYRAFLYKTYLGIKQYNLFKSDQEAKSIFNSLQDYKRKLRRGTMFFKIEDNHPNKEIWNKIYDDYLTKTKRYPDFINTPLLYTESLYFRSILSFFYKSKFFKKFDPYRRARRDTILRNRDSVHTLLMLTIDLKKRLKEKKTTIDEEIQNFAETALWGNKYDFLIPLYYNKKLTVSGLLNNIYFLRRYILKNEMKKVINFLKKPKKDFKLLIVTEGSGIELLADFCFLEMLYQTKILDEETSSVTFHTKLEPWFLSDTMKNDIYWLVNYLIIFFDNENIRRMTKRWLSKLNQNKWLVEAPQFYTLPYTYNEMPEKDPNLYENLKEFDLIIYKGDINYRKLIGDLLWDHSTPLKVALRGFTPTNFVTLRPIRTRPTVGFSNLEIFEKLPEKWFYLNNYGLIDFYEKN